MQGFVDEERAVLGMAGADARTVLQGVVTNDVDRLTVDAPLYAALLTPQGKYLFDFFLLDSGQGMILIDVAADRAEALVDALTRYCLRRDARVGALPGLQVALVWGAEPEAPTGGMAVADPRDAGLGWRLYGQDLAAKLGDLTGSRAGYDALRVRLGVPQTGVELVPEQAFILEHRFEALGGVDFRKGCYVGQEVTARMKHKTELRKGLVRVAVDGMAAPGTAITSGGKPAGTLFTVADGTGLAHLRLDRAGPDMQAGTARVDYDPQQGG